MILKAQMQTVGDKTVVSGMRWYTSDQYGLLIMVGGQTGLTEVTTDTTDHN